MRLSDLIPVFEETISERWEQSCDMEYNEYCDYHSFDRVTIRYEKGLKYLKARFVKENKE